MAPRSPNFASFGAVPYEPVNKLVSFSNTEGEAALTSLRTYQDHVSRVVGGSIEGVAAWNPHSFVPPSNVQLSAQVVGIPKQWILPVRSKWRWHVPGTLFGMNPKPSGKGHCTNLDRLIQLMN